MSSEFDAYASEYSAGMEHPLKSLLGSSAKAYLQPKVNWLVKYLSCLKTDEVCDLKMASKLLEVGCGTGSFLECLHDSCFPGELYGADISQLMLEKAKSNCGNAHFSATFTLMEVDSLPYPDCFFEIVVACSLLHHVPPCDRESLFSEFNRVLVPNGVLVVFEHNPWNLLTQIVVRTTSIDKNASLLSASNVRMLAKNTGFVVDREEYLMFFPPRWSYLSSFEKVLARVPLGAQYAVAARRPVPK